MPFLSSHGNGILGTRLHADKFAWHDNVSVKLTGDGAIPSHARETIFPSS